MKEVRLFCGYDPREAIGFHTFLASLIATSSPFPSARALTGQGMPEGSNSFTLSRFLVPYLCNFRGWALFVDAADMVLLSDINQLLKYQDPQFAVMVVRHPEYTSLHARKYVGTPMETEQSNYRRKNWASVMLINCGHPAWRDFTPALVANSFALDLLQFRFLPDNTIGALPAEWNVLVDEGQPLKGARLLHWTAGIPAFPHYSGAPAAHAWHAARRLIGE